MPPESEKRFKQNYDNAIQKTLVQLVQSVKCGTIIFATFTSVLYKCFCDGLGSKTSNHGQVCQENKISYLTGQAHQWCGTARTNMIQLVQKTK